MNSLSLFFYFVLFYFSFPLFFFFSLFSSFLFSFLLEMELAPWNNLEASKTREPDNSVNLDCYHF